MENLLLFVAIGLFLYLIVALNNLKDKFKAMQFDFNELKIKFAELQKQVFSSPTPLTDEINNAVVPDVEQSIQPTEFVLKPIQLNRIIPPEIEVPNSEKTNLKAVVNGDVEESYSASIVNSAIQNKTTLVDVEPLTSTNSSNSTTPIEALWSKFEKQFIENWTGILGTAIMVLGIGFLSIYTAIKLTEIYRFIILLTYASALTGAYFWLRNKSEWAKMGLWLRSAGAALYLFSCLGAGFIDGLKFIQSPILALVVLNIGIVINLFLAYAGGQQVFASIHVAISLIALSVVPNATITELTMGGMIALFGIALTYKHKWEYHLLACISLFFGFHLLWYYHHTQSLSIIENYAAIFIVASVSIAAMLVHYRKAYQQVKFDMLPFIIHIINWSYFATGLIMHSTGNKWKTIILIFAAAASYFLSRNAKQKQIQWLYYSDAIISTIILFVALFTLNDWLVDDSIIITLMIFVALLFQFMVHHQHEKLLFKYICIVQQCLCVAAFIIFSELNFAHTWFDVLHFKTVLTLFVAIALAGYHIYQSKQFKEEFKDTLFASWHNTISVSGLMSAGFVLQFLCYSSTVPFVFLVGCAIAIIYLWLNKKIQTSALAISSAALMVANIVFFDFHISNTLYPTWLQLIFSIGVFIPLFISIAWSYVQSINQHIKWLGIYLSVAFAIYLVYQLSPNNYFIAYSFMAIAAIIIELSTFVSKKYNSADIEKQAVRHLLFSGYVMLLLLQISYIPQYVQHCQFVNRDIQFVFISLLNAALMASYFIFQTRIKPISDSFKKQTNFHFVFFELTVATLYLIACKEIYWQYHPIILLSSCFIFIFTQHQKIIQQRIKIYLLLFLSVSFTAFIYSSYRLQLPLNTALVDWMINILSILLFLVLAFVIHQKQHDAWLKSISKLVFALVCSFMVLQFASPIWQALYWILFAFATLIIYRVYKITEFVWYSIAYYFITAFSIAFISSQYININTYILSTPSVVSILVQLFMVLLVYFLYKWMQEEYSEIQIFKWLTQVKKPLLIYPLTFSIAIFLFFSYEKSLLTLLWVMECFVLFALSLVLGEKQFRLISLTALLACIVRLFFYDLSRTNTITKALVFLGVGIIMIAINSLHNKFKDRYKIK
jgi:hypothetical protein